eukprot:4513689-Pleurochrysis_carterae.AAC.1
MPNASHTSELQFATDGVNVGNCQEISGCLALGNLLAAIYGLYFYPGCEEAENNWIVEQRIGNQTHSIRMR